MFFFQQIAFVVMFMFAWQLYGQQYSFDIEHLNIDKGLSNRFVNHINQDSRGFIWVSTNVGLNRYDGRTFKEFSKEKDGLQSNTCQNTVEDIWGNVWIVYRADYGKKNAWINERHLLSGIDVLDYKTGKIQKLAEKYPSLSIFQNRQLTSLQSDSRHYIWISTYEGELFLFDGKLHLIFSNKDDAPILTSVSNQDKCWIVTTNSLKEIDPCGNIIKTFSFPPILEGKLSFSSEGILWISLFFLDATQGNYCQSFYINKDKTLKLRTVRDQTGKVSALKTSMVHEIIPTSDGNFWLIGAPPKAQLTLYAANGDMIYDFSKERHKEAAIRKAGGFSHLFIDDNNIIWVSSDNGIIKVIPHPSSTLFRPFLNRLNGASIRGIAPISDHQVWVNSTLGWGIVHLDSTPINKNITSTLCFSSFYYNQGYGVSNINNTYMLIGAYGPSVFKVNPQTKNILKTYTYPGYGRSIIPFQSSRTKKIWLASELGLAYLDPVRDSILFYNTPSGSLFKTIDHRINSFVESKEGLWLVTSEGLILLDEHKGVQAFYNHFPHNILIHLHIDQEGHFWLATKGGGLLEWNRITNEIKQYTKATGLSDNILYAVYEDHCGYLWLPSNYGLMRFNKKTHEVHLFLPKDGLPHEEFNFTAHNQMPDGRLVFGGLNGIVVFNPEEVPEILYDAPLQLTTYQELSPSTGAMLDKTLSLLQTGSICLTHAIKSFYLEFALMDFADVKSHRFAYKIEGYDLNWNYIKENYIRVNKLPPGEYRLHIKGQGSGGIWSAKNLSIPILVTRPFYQQTWFILILVVLIIGGVYTYIQWHTARLRASEKRLMEEVQKRTQELEQLNKTKDKLFSIIGHELRGPLTYFQTIGENLQYLLQKGDWKRATDMGTSIKDSAKNINHILDNLLYWGLAQNFQLPYQPQLVSLDAVFEEMYNLFSDLAHRKGIEIQKPSLSGLYVYADERALCTILRNLISNAIKFTNTKGKVMIHANLVDNKISQIIVQDTGIGMTPNQLSQVNQLINLSQIGTHGEKGTGLGLALCRELIARNKGSLRIESHIQLGTTVFIQFPAH